MTLLAVDRVDGTTAAGMSETSSAISPSLALYATVAVDQPVDAAYTYAVPPALRRLVQVGSRVTVPLGRGNRISPATVLELSTNPPPEKPAKEVAEDEATLFEPLPPPTGTESAVKAIADVLTDVLPIPVDLLDLAKWISAYYCAPIGMTLSTMVPAAVKRATRLPANVMITLADPARPAAEQIEHLKLSPKGRAAFETLHAFLREGGRNEQEALTHVGTGRPLLKRLMEAGLIRMERIVKLPESAPIGAMLAEEGAKDLDLTADQRAAMEQLEPLLTSSGSGFAVRLIHGVTGSGKTELYIRAIEKVVAQGKRAIVLVPEISLTPQTVRRFTARFPRVAVLHSGLKDSERHQHWHAIATGWAQVIVGARSAIFAPAADIGIIIVDEEHDPSYKQDSLPKYHGRDVAIRRGQMLGVPVLLGSATPALESWHNAHHNPHWGLISLKSRPMGTEMPRVVTVDMKAEAKVRRGLHILSTTLEHYLKATLAAKKQAIFLLNRRGYAHYLMCPRCDWVLMCENCDATMVVHRKRTEGGIRTEEKGLRTESGGTQSSVLSTHHSSPPQHSARQAARDSIQKKGTTPHRHIEGTVQCHYCLTSRVLPEICPLCQARLTHLGQGTQRAEDELLRKFPELGGGRLQRMDSDSMTHLSEYQKTLDAFGRGEIDLLIGTQMISKGLDFPNVALVGVLNSDLAMTMPDFRAAERTFQLICQVAGRSGRAMGGARGTVIVQTFQPTEPAIVHACNHDYLGFVRTELPNRKEFAYPPYGRLARIVLSHKGQSNVRSVAEGLVRLIHALTHKLELPVRVHGPIPPPMERVNELYRLEIILFADSPAPIQRILASLRARGVLASRQVGVSVDVDPLHMM